MVVDDLMPESKDHRTRQRVIEAAADRLAYAPYDDGLLADIIDHTGLSPDQVKLFFQGSEDVLIALYARFASDLESRVGELPEGNTSERFHALMKLKFQIMEPYRKALAGLGKILPRRRTKLGVLSRETEVIRIRVSGVLAATIAGATDQDSSSIKVFSRSLYSLYLAIMWIWFKDGSARGRKSEMLLDISCRMMSLSAPLLRFPLVKPPLKLLNRILEGLLFEDNTPFAAKAMDVLTVLYKRRRSTRGAGACGNLPCAQCFALHVPKVAYFVSNERPIHLILPAFPAKSPNRRKTLGALPDMAEEQALLYLADVCAEIGEVYSPGVRLTICSDGHVFSDLVGVSDDDVTRYGHEIRNMIARLGLAHTINTFSLKDLFENIDLPSMRGNMHRHYEQPLDVIRKRASKVPQAASLVNGIHRFMFEDRIELEPDRSRTGVRNECRDLAYGVVQRSDGWGRLLADCFPMALRLSIHPQEPHSDKIGILLGAADDVWLTPWHGVAVRENDRFRLMKRHEAEALGARLVESAEHANFYEL